VDYDNIGAGRVLERKQPTNNTRLTMLNDAGTADVGYDGMQRPVQLRHLRSNNSLVVGFSHTYNRNSAKLIEEKLHASTDSELYRYDRLSRLTDMQRGTLNGARHAIDTPSPREPLHTDWLLDGTGNWRQVQSTEGGGWPVTESRLHTSFNEIYRRDPGTTIDILSDNNGNETDDGNLIFEWDAKNRLRTVTRKSDNQLIATYSYDAADRRIRKVVTNSGDLNGTTYYYVDGWQEIEERDGSDGLVQQYVYGNYIDEPLVRDRNLGGGDTATGPGDQRLVYHQNGLFSVFGLTDASGAIVEGYQYDAYGRQTVYAPGGNGVVDFGDDDVITLGGTSSVANAYMYTGRRLDAESGLLYYRHRYLSPEQGRFVSRDPIGVWGDTSGLGSAYAYVGGAPSRNGDPTGLDATVVVKTWTNPHATTAGSLGPGGWQHDCIMHPGAWIPGLPPNCKITTYDERLRFCGAHDARARACE
jgi:RHS repeat-associated protein